VQENRTCFRCGIKGHIASACRVAQHTEKALIAGATLNETAARAEFSMDDPQEEFLTQPTSFNLMMKCGVLPTQANRDWVLDSGATVSATYE